jgi:hypothetical protein
MRLLELQAKSLLSQFGLRFNDWTTATSPAAALTDAELPAVEVTYAAPPPAGLARAKRPHLVTTFDFTRT